ncbi:MAG: dipicolinate synthase subunit DpsA [Clostridia bacterium]|nr:dipicolinate synthase subunit DpsA [Clostridia bacterium]
MNICVVGGDTRIVELIKLLKENENTVIELYGLEKSEELRNYSHSNNVYEAIQNAEIIITSIPLSKDNKTINATFTDKRVLLEDFFKNIKNKKIITGNITDEIRKYIKLENNNEVIDILKYEELAILNAIPTAEGAIKIAMEKSQITIHNSKCLVLGFGRIGKMLAKKLHGIGANVFCEARKQHDIAWIKSLGYTAIHLDELDKNLGKFDFIFNTIPYIILNKSNLQLIKKECVLIDLASKPGGIDFEEANRLNLKTDWALALPGKVAPKTSANYIYDVISKLL